MSDDVTKLFVDILGKLVGLLAIKIPDLEAKMATYAEDVAALKQAAADIGADVKAVVAEFATLKAQIAAGSPPDTTDLEAAIGALQGSHGDLQSAVTAAGGGGGGVAGGGGTLPR